MKQTLMHTQLFLFGAFLYCILEILYRGFTHPSMFFLGGLCFLLISVLDRQISEDVPIYLKMFYGASVITILEFFTGVICNLILELDVWDYSTLPLNILGQICFPFFVIWFFLCFPAILLSRLILRYAWAESFPKHLPSPLPTTQLPTLTKIQK